MGKKTVRGHDIANRFVYSLSGMELPYRFLEIIPIFHLQVCQVYH